MLIKKGTIVEVRHQRTGKWIGIAYENFDTEDEWYKLKVHQKQAVFGRSTEWFEGDEIPARKGLCTLNIKEGAK